MAFPTITSRSRRRATTCVLTFITSTAVLTSLSPLTAASRHLCHRSAHLFTRSSSPSLAPSLTPATRTRTYVHSRSNSATSISMSCSHPADDSDLYGGGEGTLVKAANDNPSAAIIFLHGLGKFFLTSFFFFNFLLSSCFFSMTILNSFSRHLVLIYLLMVSSIFTSTM